MHISEKFRRCPKAGVCGFVRRSGRAGWETEICYFVLQNVILGLRCVGKEICGFVDISRERIGEYIKLGCAHFVGIAYRSWAA